MTKATFDAMRKAYKAGASYARTKAYQEGDGESLSAYAKAKYASEDERALFVSGVYDQDRIDFYTANPDATSEWSS